MTRLAIRVEEKTFYVEIGPLPDTGRHELRLGDRTVQVMLPLPGAPTEGLSWLVIDGRPYEIELDPELRWIASGSVRQRLEIKDMADVRVRALKGNGRVKAPIPGQITRLFVTAGQAVQADQPLCVLEAMKMENEIRAPQAGVVSALPIAVGQIVSRGHLLAEIDCA
jgi:biotin carboxyl carrier protein